eukprot:2452631-Amphidinium_carterae.2
MERTFDIFHTETRTTPGSRDMPQLLWTVLVMSLDLPHAFVDPSKTVCSACKAILYRRAPGEPEVAARLKSIAALWNEFLRTHYNTLRGCKRDVIAMEALLSTLLNEYDHTCH